MKNYDILDTTNLICPQPILATKKKLYLMDAGKKLQVVSNDPSYQIDLKVLLRKCGDILLKTWQNGEKFYYIIEKANTRSL